MVSEGEAENGASTKTLSKERFLELREIVEKAAQGRKTFTVFGKYTSIRDALKTRGWIQNFDLRKLTLPKQQQTQDDVSLAARLVSHGDDERQIISRLLRRVPVSFVWATTEPIDWNALAKSTIVSRFPRVYFTTKVGIANYLGECHWFVTPDVSAHFPRCYILSTPEDYDIFVKDFRLTSCLGFLNTLMECIQKKHINIFVETGKVPLKTVDFAIRRLREYVSSREHEDIDREIGRIWDHQWEQFLTHYYQFVHNGEAFQTATEQQIQEIYSNSKAALEAIHPHWPQMEMDGTRNTWILKPGAKSRGRGIQVMNRLELIQNHLDSLSPNEPQFVIQKYIERPLLIHNTKFDIRQWFLVTCIYPLTIWMYKECYLRFCTHLFSLTNMHESVHLSNNAIQCKYRNERKRNAYLPDENMWDSLSFQAYLRSQGVADTWEKIIYPGMRGAFTCALLAAQEHAVARPNTFELYGADFMLTEDFQPWLIEINSSPCMSPTTSVTARLCPQCLEDIIKVVIDRRMDRDAETGMFELAYKQDISSPQPYTGINLTIRGTRLRAAPRVSSSPTNRLSSSERSMKGTFARKLSSASNGTLTPIVEIRRGTEQGRRVKRHCCSERMAVSHAVQRFRRAKNAESVPSRFNTNISALHGWKKRITRRQKCKTTLVNLNVSTNVKPNQEYGSRSKLPQIRKHEINNNNLHLNLNYRKQYKVSSSLLHSMNM